MTSKSPQAVEAFKAGRELSENLRSAEADTQFRKAIGLDPVPDAAPDHGHERCPAWFRIARSDLPASAADVASPARREWPE